MTNTQGAKSCFLDPRLIAVASLTAASDIGKFAADSLLDTINSQKKGMTLQIRIEPSYLWESTLQQRSHRQIDGESNVL
jgi:hypothetical protein